MRCRTTIATLVVTVSALAVATPGPADAGTVRGAAHGVGKGGTECRTSVFGVDSTRHVRYADVTNSSVTTTLVSSETLGFDVTAWGIFDSQGTSTHSTQRFDTVTTDGTPRRVTIDRNSHAVKIGKVERYQQDGFTPRLFADGYGFFGYTIGGGTLKRYPLTHFANGDEKFVHPEKVGSGFGDLTSLQSASFVKGHGVVNEILYATTSAGGLLQIVAPVDRPGRARVHKLAKSGYEGVTELSWSQCNTRGDRQSLIAINPTTNQATWTTIKHSFTHPKAKLRGAVTGGVDWNLSAVL